MADYKEDQFEDISSRSDDFIDDEFEDFDTGRYTYEDDYDYEDEGIPLTRKEQKTYVDQTIQQKTAPKHQRIPDEYEDFDTKAPKKKKKESLKRRILKIVGIILLVFVVLIGIAVLSVYNKLSHAEETHHENPYISEDQLHSDKNVTNILLVGVDAREGETVSRSDTMMIVSIDRNSNKMKITSFLRDSYVEIPGHGWNKLNASMSWGGIDLLWDTLEYNFKIKIDNYMQVDFIAFEKMIDALGGVNVPITETEANYLSTTWAEWTLTGTPLTFESGDSVHLNGEEALMFCRIRKLDSDFERTRRQRETISGIKHELMHTNPIELIKLSNGVLPNVETDITSTKMLKLGFGAIFKYLRYDIESLGVPIDGTWQNASKACGACLVFDMEKTADMLNDYIYNDINPLAESE